MNYKTALQQSACVGIALAALAAATTASAGEGEPGSQAIPSAQSNMGPSDIIVTARLRAERLQDVPVVATTLDSAELAKYNSSSINQIATRTPGLIVSDSTNPVGGAINIRGIGAPTAGPFVDQAVSINIDGVQVSQAVILRLGLFDLDRVEVLKGPQTLFFGKNSPSGIISIISAGPSDHLEAKLRAGYETEAQNKYVEAMISTPLTSTLGARFDGYFGDQRGWFVNRAQSLPLTTLPNGTTAAANIPNARHSSNTRTYFGRGTLAYKSETGLMDATLKIAYGKQTSPNGITANGQLGDCPTGNYQGATNAGRVFTECKLDRYYGEGRISPRLAAISSTFGDGSLYSHNSQFLTSLTVDIQPSEQIKATSVTGYVDIKSNARQNYSFDGGSYIVGSSFTRIKQFSQELRALTSFDFPLNFMVGGYYQHLKIGNRQEVGFDTPISGRFTGGAFTGPIIYADADIHQRTNAYSVYGQGILDITPELQLTVGGRYSHERKALDFTKLPNSASATTSSFAITPDTVSFDNFSPDITLRYKALPNLTLYAAYREGFLSGGFDPQPTIAALGATSRNNIDYRPESTRGGEVGAKGSLFNKQLIFDVAAFYYKYTDLQLSAFDPNTLGFRLTNAGTAISKGAEASLQFRPAALPGISARAGIAYTPAKYGSFPNAPCYPGQTQAAGCNLIASRNASGTLVTTPATSTQVANAQDLSGEPLFRNSKWNVNLGASYDHALGNGMSVSLSGDANYASRYIAGPTAEPASVQRSAWRYDARIALNGKDDRWELALLGTNLSNVLRATHAFQASGTGRGTGTTNGLLGDEILTPGQVRTITIQATLRY